jgi:hypothetical protein
MILKIPYLLHCAYVVARHRFINEIHGRHPVCWNIELEVNPVCDQGEGKQFTFYIGNLSVRLELYNFALVC